MISIKLKNQSISQESLYLPPTGRDLSNFLWFTDPKILKESLIGYLAKSCSG